MSDKFRLSRDLMNITIAVICNPEIHVPDLLTKIRILPTVAVVGQSDKVMRTESGDTVVDIYVKFLPVSKKEYKNIIAMCELIKSLPGVNKIKVLELNKKKVTFNGNQIVV
tara:strand:+ start:370 stop:702 length:333 start_codon:yes stop_codon:yes gene_type:complete